MALAIIDGDVLAYQACYFVWEDRVAEAKRIHDEVRPMLREGETDFEVPPMTKEQEARYLEKAWKNFVRLYRELMDTTFCSESIMAVGGENNYRFMMYPEYKLKRNADPTKRNAFVPILRQLAVFEDFAIAAHDREADDLIRIWALEAGAAGDEFIVCENDKDLRCIPGTHYDMKNKIFLEISELDAKRVYYEQMLKGDVTTDNIPGIPGIGTKKAAAMCAHCITDAEFQEVVVSNYIAYYGDDWYSYFLSNAKMIHIQRHLNDYFNAAEWPIILELR